MTVKITLPPSATWAGSVGRQTIGSLGSSEDSTNGSLKKPNFNERHPKVVRSLTVVAYIFCVSLAAIILSAYYVVLWTPSTDSSKSINVNTTNLPCSRGVTYGPDGEVEDLAPKYYRQSRFTYSSGRHMRPRTSKYVGHHRTKSPSHHQLVVDKGPLSIQRDSPFLEEEEEGEGSHRNSSSSSPNNDERKRNDQPSLEEGDEEDIYSSSEMEEGDGGGTSFLPHFSSHHQITITPPSSTSTASLTSPPPSPPDSILLRRLLQASKASPTTGATEKPR